MRFVFAALLALLAAPVSAQAPAPSPPKLLVVISVDQFSSILFDEYRAHFTGGLKRLAEGIAFANGYQAHAATETCPGHSTILTGDHPARTGIIANDWVDPRAPRSDKIVYCAEDERAAGSSSKAYTVSASHLRVPTLGDRMKQADRASRVVAVSGKDRASQMMGGHAPDQLWWWSAGRFVPGLGIAAPAAAGERANAAVAEAIAQEREPLVPPDFCAAKDRPVDVAPGKVVGTFRFQRAAGDAGAFASGPELDASTLALAAALIGDMQLGRGPATDLLAVGLSATDFVGHRYGPEGLEMCLQLMSLDADLGGFLALLDRSGISYAVVLTADHGGLDLPERQRPSGAQHATRLDPAATSASIGREVSAQLGLAAPAFLGGWYLDPAVPEARRGEALALARRLLAAQPQVEAVYGKDEIAGHPMPAGRPEAWSLLDRLRASFDPQRSPDLAVVYKQGITTIPAPVTGSVATHGSPWDYDRKVPILFWWPGIAASNRSESAMTVDIMPTLARMIGLRIAAGEVDGHCLGQVVRCQ